MSDVAHSALPLITTVARWGARILSALILMFWSFFIAAHLVGDEGRSTRPLTTSDYISLTTMIVSLAGLGVAWKWELIGAAMTIVAILIGAFANWRSLAFPGALIALAAGLFLLCWLMSRARTERGDRKKPGEGWVKFCKITACPNLRNQTSTNSKSPCSGSARSFGDASSSEAIQPSPIYTTPYKSHLDGPTIIFTASLFMADNTALPISVGSIFVMTRGESNFPTSACASRKSSSTNTISTTSGGT
jgi:hypothetical protein